MTIYSDMLAAGVQIDHHETDLYVEDCAESRAVLAKHGKRVDGWNVQRFISNVDGKPWLDLPFQYSPGWERR
jgi:hypothetical protein